MSVRINGASANILFDLTTSFDLTPASDALCIAGWFKQVVNWTSFEPFVSFSQLSNSRSDSVESYNNGTTGATGAFDAAANGSGFGFTGVPLPINTWIYIAISRPAGANPLTTWFIGDNTTLVEKQNFTALSQLQRYIRIGQLADPTAVTSLNGEVAHVRAWARVFSNAELLAEASATAPVITTGLLFSHHFNDTSSVDQGPNAFTFTTSGSVTNGASDPPPGSFGGATTTQEGFLWRADDGSETAASSLATQDTSVTRTTGINTRLRFLIDTTADLASTQFQLETKLSSDSVYAKVEAAGAGALAFGTIGTTTNTGTTAPTVAYPASIAAGDYLLMAVVNRPNASTPTIPAGGWTQLATVTGGAGSEAAGTGVIRVTVFGREAVGTESGSVTLAITSGTSCGAVIWRSTKTTGKNWDAATATGSDNSAGTAFSVTFGTDPGVTAGDLVFVAAGSSEDTATWASEALSQTGMTYGALTEHTDTAVSTGNDCRIIVCQHAVTSGTSSAAGTFTATASSTNAANTAGAAVMIRLRQIDKPIQLALSSQFADSDTTTAQLAAPSGKTTADFVAGEMCESSNPAPAIDITTDDYTEIEWCLKASSNASNGQIYDFRVTKAGSALNTYGVSPQWTIGTPGTGASQARKRRQRIFGTNAH